MLLWSYKQAQYDRGAKYFQDDHFSAHLAFSPPSHSTAAAPSTSAFLHVSRGHFTWVCDVKVGAVSRA